MKPNIDEENLVHRLGLQLDYKSDRNIVVVGIKAIANEFRVSPDKINGADVMFKTIKPPLLSEVDAMNMILSVEKVIGRIVDAESSHLLSRIYLVRVDEWLLRLVEALKT